MRKVRFIYLIFSFLTIIVLTTLSIIYDFSFLFVILMLIVLIPNYMFRNQDRRLTQNVIMGYGFNCDPYRYIDDMRNFSKKCILTKKQKLIYSIYYAIANIDAGNFDDAKELLLDIDSKSDLLDEVTKVLYLKAWIDYFWYNNYDEKMKITLLKLKDLIIKSNNNTFKFSYSLIYGVLEAKYYILINQNLGRAKEILQERKGQYPTKLSKITGEYQLAILDLRENRINDAINKLKDLSTKNDSLYVVRQSKKILSDLS